MEITRLTNLLGADPREVEDLVRQIEERDADDRTDLLAQLSRALRLDGGDADGAAVTRESVTEYADAVAIDLGFD